MYNWQVKDPPAKSRTIRFADDKEKENKQESENKEKDNTEKEKEKERDIAKVKPTTLQQKMLAMAGQDIDQFMREMEVVHKKRETERAQDLNARLSLLEAENDSTAKSNSKSNNNKGDDEEPEPPGSSDHLAGSQHTSQQHTQQQQHTMPPIGIPPPPLLYRPPPPPLHLRMPPPPPPRIGLRLPPGDTFFLPFFLVSNFYICVIF